MFEGLKTLDAGVITWQHLFLISDELYGLLEQIVPSDYLARQKSDHEHCVV